tara:strand:+ start:19624 stop:20463 length:840 start_codon:yes stop_codon:yes gene_type:complete
MSNRIIGITGASGFIGSNCKKKLSKNFEVIEINLRNFNSIDDLTEHINKNQITHFLNCIGGKSVGYSKLYPLEDFKSNVECPLKILYALKRCKNKIHFTHISSAGVYGEQSINDQKNFIFSPYAIHKQAFDSLLQSTPLNNIEYLIVRPFSVYGPGLKKQLLWDSYHKFKSNQTSVFFGSGKEVRSFVYIDDLSTIISDHIDQGIKGIIDIGSKQIVNVGEVLNRFNKVLKLDASIKFNNLKDNGNPINLSKIQNEIKTEFNNYTSLEIGLKKYADWIG